MPGPSPIHSLPAEILSMIFPLVEDYRFDRVHLMLVCRRWYDVMLSTPGIPSKLWIRKSTTIEMVRASIQGTRWLLDVRINMDDKDIEQDFNAGAIDACFSAAIEAASRWETLRISSFPRCKVLRTVPPLKSLESFHLGHGCDLGNFFEPLMIAITTTATSLLTYIQLDSLTAVLYLVQPDCFHVFCSLTRLEIWLPKRMESPVDILPHLQRLRAFAARYLYVPIYPSDPPLLLIQTLNYLTLKSVSVQWMAGKVFPVLRSCNITFPQHVDTLRLQPVTMPVCSDLTYTSNDLDSLRCFHDLPLKYLTVNCGQWNVRRGNLQLISICDMVYPRAQGLTTLDLQVRCSDQLLARMLSLLPALKTLWLTLASPRALNEAFFQKFVATKSNADSLCETGAVASPPLCLKLMELSVQYKRWLRRPERMALLLVFGDIVSSRRYEYFDLHLSVEGFAQDWCIWCHVERIHEVEDVPFVTGVSSPHGIIPLYMTMHSSELDIPFKEVEYFVARGQISIECLLTLHHLVELRVGGILPSAPPPNLPLFHTLRVLEAENIHHSFLTGQIFHKLERCRMSVSGEGPDLSMAQVTHMPACTRLDVEDLTLLATFKLPQIRELGASFDHPEFNMIWETHIAVNINLSGLELLHVHGWAQQADLTQVLRFLPVLKSLVIRNGLKLHADFFREFVPVHQNWLSMLVTSHYEGQISLLCPMLKSFLIDGVDPTKQRELIPVLKEVVILRAVCGSPLERLTFYARLKMRELVRSQGGSVEEIVSVDEDSALFLDI